MPNARTHLKNHFRREALWFRAKAAKPDKGIPVGIARRDERLRAEIHSCCSRKRVFEMGSIHKDLAHGRWFELSLMEQMANIGSEVNRAAIAQGKNAGRFTNAVARALDLFDLTLLDPRWTGRRFEIARARELFCAAMLGANEYETSLEDLDRYFSPFAVAARGAGQHIQV